MTKKKLINKYAKKMSSNCYFCNCDNYDLLDVHRIAYQCENNQYTDFNTIVCCVSCHRLIHCGSIKIDRKYFSTSGKWILHYWINEEEKWK